MKNRMTENASPPEVERNEWRDSVENILHRYGPINGAAFLRQIFAEFLSESPAAAARGFRNDIAADREPSYPGDLAIEEQITNINRWNAAAMVLRANKKIAGIGGHLSTYASASELFEVGFNHFFRGSSQNSGAADFVFFQGHASPGVYARSFLEGRFSSERLLHFRQEVFSENGLSSYPHPWLMPEYWQFPTVSMGLGPIMSIYLARFLRYMQSRALATTAGRRVWVFLGDGEMDEPESIGALAIAGRERLSNLTFVVNCNLQRLDGPVRGNGSIIRELESIFLGAGWRVIKVLWGSEWDHLLEGPDANF